MIVCFFFPFTTAIYVGRYRRIIRIHLACGHSDIKTLWAAGLPILPILLAIREASEASYLSISHILPGSNTVLEFLEFGGFAAWLLTSAHNQLRLFGACQIFDK